MKKRQHDRKSNGKSNHDENKLKKRSVHEKTETRTAHNVNDKLRTEDIATEEEVDFASLLLSPRVLAGLSASGFEKPSPIQLKAIPLGKCGIDLICQAKSGTGKTCVFAVVALESVDISCDGAQVLVVAPTREIAHQIDDVVRHIGCQCTGLRCHVFIGGTKVSEDIESAKKCHVAVGTPGRLKFLIENGHLATDSIRLFVLDEADKLLEDGMQEQINWIYSTLPVHKQVLALSATYPEELAKHLTNYMQDPIHVRICTDELALKGVRQYYIKVNFHPLPHRVFEAKAEVLLSLLERLPFQQCMVFSNLQSRAEFLNSKLLAAGWPSTFIAGSQTQQVRMRSMQQLREFNCRVLISTDLTSRGIDCERVNLIVNLDLPWDSETYLHRIGRSGRFGSHGVAVSLVAEGEEVKTLQSIGKKIGRVISSLPSDVDDIYESCDEESVHEVDAEEMPTKKEASHIIGRVLKEEIVKKNLKDEQESIRKQHQQTEPDEPIHTDQAMLHDLPLQPDPPITPDSSVLHTDEAHTNGESGERLDFLRRHHLPEHASTDDETERLSGSSVQVRTVEDTCDADSRQLPTSTKVLNETTSTAVEMSTTEQRKSPLIVSPFASLTQLIKSPSQCACVTTEENIDLQDPVVRTDSSPLPRLIPSPTVSPLKTLAQSVPSLPAFALPVAANDNDDASNSDDVSSYHDVSDRRVDSSLDADERCDLNTSGEMKHTTSKSERLQVNRQRLARANSDIIDSTVDTTSANRTHALKSGFRKVRFNSVEIEGHGDTGHELVDMAASSAVTDQLVTEDTSVASNMFTGADDAAVSNNDLAPTTCGANFFSLFNATANNKVVAMSAIKRNADSSQSATPNDSGRSSGKPPRFHPMSVCHTFLNLRQEPDGSSQPSSLSNSDATTTTSKSPDDVRLPRVTDDVVRTSSGDDDANDELPDVEAFDGMLSDFVELSLQQELRGGVGSGGDFVGAGADDSTSEAYESSSGESTAVAVVVETPLDDASKLTSAVRNQESSSCLSSSVSDRDVSRDAECYKPISGMFGGVAEAVPPAPVRSKKSSQRRAQERQKRACADALVESSDASESRISRTRRSSRKTVRWQGGDHVTQLRESDSLTSEVDGAAACMHCGAKSRVDVTEPSAGVSVGQVVSNEGSTAASGTSAKRGDERENGTDDGCLGGERYARFVKAWFRAYDEHMTVLAGYRRERSELRRKWK